MERKIVGVFFFLLVTFLECNSGMIQVIDDTNAFHKNNTNDEVSLQDLLPTSREIQKTQTEVDDTTTPLRTTTLKVSQVNKRETTLSIISVLQDSTTLSLKSPTTESTPLNNRASETVLVKKTTLPLTMPKTLPYYDLSKTITREPSSTISSLAFTNGKASPTEIDGKEQCFIRDTLMCVDELKCHGSGEIDCSSSQDYKDEYYYDDEKTSSTSTTSPIKPKELTNNDTLKAYLNFNRRRKKIQHTTKGGRNNNNNFLDDQEYGAEDAKPCMITGDVQCLPVPTYYNCRGKSMCGDPKKEGTASGLKDWEIAVISVLTILGVALLSALIYVIYSSWKKKKVRPRPSVPTTNVHHIMGRRIHA